MRILSGLLIAAALVLAGCGGGDDRAGDPHGIATQVQVVSQTMSGVAKEDTATPLPDAASVASYVAGLGPLGPQVRSAADTMKPGPGATLYAQVVYVGCHPAPAESVSASRSGDAVTLSSDFTEESSTECFAPVVSVALAVISD